MQASPRLDFPPYSPDLKFNPIESLWAFRVETVEELQDVISDEWNEIGAETLQSLADSMPARCAAVIEAQGSHTKYYRTITNLSTLINPSCG